MAECKNDVFVGSFAVERAGHVCSFWSDEDRMSFGSCSCGDQGQAPSAALVLDLWRAHVDAMRGATSAR